MVFLAEMGTQEVMDQLVFPDLVGPSTPGWGRVLVPRRRYCDGITEYRVQGGGTKRLCLPTPPEYTSTLTSRDGASLGLEYQDPVVQGTHNLNTRPTVLMIPANDSCLPSWTREYFV